MKRLWICLLAFALLTGCGDSGDIAVTTVYETDDPPRTALTTEWETYDPSVETVWCILSYEGKGNLWSMGRPIGWMCGRRTAAGPRCPWLRTPDGMPCCIPCRPVKSRRFRASCPCLTTTSPAAVRSASSKRSENIRPRRSSP